MIDINTVLDEARKKMDRRNQKQGNTSTPWADFTTEHLEKRLDDEFREWKASGDSEELLDIINLAVFVGMSRCLDESSETPTWAHHLDIQRLRKIEKQIINLEEAISHSLTQFWDVGDYKEKLFKLRIEQGSITRRLGEG